MFANIFFALIATIFIFVLLDDRQHFNHIALFIGALNKCSVFFESISEWKLKILEHPFSQITDNNGKVIVHSHVCVVVGVKIKIAKMQIFQAHKCKHVWIYVQLPFIKKLLLLLGFDAFEPLKFCSSMRGF